MLTKTQELKRQQQEYDEYLLKQEENVQKEEEKKRKNQLEQFESSQKVVNAKRQKLETNALKRTSYWLADMQ